MPIALHQQTRQIQTQTQTQTLTPQMQQALAILQAPMVELRDLIRQEIDTNPTLELEDPTEQSIDAAREEYDAAPTEERDFDEDLDGGSSDPSLAEAAPGLAEAAPGLAEAAPAASPAGESPPTSGGDSPDGEVADSPDGEALPSPEESEGLAALGSDADYLYSDGDNNEYDPDAEERRQFLFDSIPARESLQEHLMLQLAQAGLPEAEAQLCEQIVGSLDSSGYLRTPLAEIAQGSFATLSAAARALEPVQGFTPAGVGARDLRECLLLQLRADPSPATRPAMRILASQEAFEALAERRFARAASIARVTPEQAEAALAAIARLDPRPGRQYSSETSNYVRPEIEYREAGGRWTAFLLDDDLPRVRVSPFWRARAAALKEAPKGEAAADAKKRRHIASYLANIER